MRIYRALKEIIGHEQGCVVAVGNFDGVHLGHGAILQQTVESAGVGDSPSLVMTFSVHPANRLRPDKAPGIIMRIEDRLTLMERAGIQAALVLPFDTQLAVMEPEEFVDRVLVDALNSVEVVAGEGWRFGKDRAGDMDLLSTLGGERGIKVNGIPAQKLGGLPISSTRIREALARGEVDLAARLLGRPHFVRGIVEHGEGRGISLGYPTVNLSCNNSIVPSRGVYAAAFAHAGKVGPAGVNIGIRPTFGTGPDTVEAHLVGEIGDIYGEEVTLIFLARLRDELAFPDKGSLGDQIGRDIARAEEVFGRYDISGVPP